MTINKSTWRNIGHITMAVCVVMSIGTYIAFSYSQIVPFGNLAATWYTAYPYQSYAIAIGVCGIISGVISIGSYVAPKYLLRAR